MQAGRGKFIALATVALGLPVLLAAGISMKEAAIEQWYLSRLEATSFTERFRAARKLGEIRSTRAIPGLIKLLRECRGHETEAAEAAGPGTSAVPLVASLLAQIGPPAVPALALALKESRGTREYWRRQACSALGRIEADEAIPPLIELVDDEDPCVRWVVFNALAARGPRARDAVPALTRAIAAQGKPRGSLHEAATSALEKILDAHDAPTAQVGSSGAPNLRRLERS